MYLERKIHVPTNTNIELEVRFGTKGKFRITHSIYDNVSIYSDEYDESNEVIL